MAGLVVLVAAAAGAGWWVGNLTSDTVASSTSGPVDPGADEADDGDGEEQGSIPAPGSDPDGAGVEVDDGPVDEPTADAVPIPERDDPEPEQPAATDARQWTRIAHNESVFGGGSWQSMWSVTAGGPGLVAVGWDGGREAAAVWTSTDGTSWQRVPHNEAVFGGERMEMWSVTVGGPGLVAVGFDGGRGAAAVWTSTDGLSWQRVPHDEAVFGGNDEQQMRAVTAGGPGLVAVGRDRGRDAAAVWTSTDGTSWQRVAHDENVFGGNRWQMMFSVAVGSRGGLYAVGLDDRAAAAWSSTDGHSWQRVAHDEAVFGGDGLQSMWSVTAGGPGLVAVGFDRERDRGVAAVWTSTDGITWKRIAHDESVFGGDGVQGMYSVTAGGPGLVAVGEDGTGFGHDEVATVWTSDDGLTWQRVAHDEAVFGGERRHAMVSVTAAGPGLVAVGSDGDLDAAAVWTSP